MPILNDYTITERNLNEKRRYNFPHNFIEQNSIEVYEIIVGEGGVEYQYLVPVTDYSIQENTTRPRYSLKDGAWITFNRRHSVGTVRVMLLRNTIIDQSTILPKSALSFNGRIIGVMADKAMMICQELALRKCQSNVSTPMYQTVDFTAYDHYKQSELTNMVEKLYQILREIDASVDDCRDNLENT